MKNFFRLLGLGSIAVAAALFLVWPVAPLPWEEWEPYLPSCGILVGLVLAMFWFSDSRRSPPESRGDLDRLLEHKRRSSGNPISA